VDERTEAGVEDVLTVAPLVLRQRRSSALTEYTRQLQEEEAHIQAEVQATRQRFARRKRPRNGQVHEAIPAPPSAEPV
jgi:hypothetical protein